MKPELRQLRKRAGQLKEKWPGYEAILDFYLQVREAQLNAKASMGAPTPGGTSVPPDRQGLPILPIEGFPVDTQGAITLFHDLCRIGKKANPHMGREVEKITRALDDNQLDLKELLTGAKNKQTIDQIAADRGLDRQILDFLIRNSLRPSIETGRDRLRVALEPETRRTSPCPICGSPPALSLLKGEEGKRYSLCSGCGYQWRIDRLSCPVCGSREQESLTYFCGEGEEAFRIDLCDICHHYIKTIDYRSLEESDPFLEDLATLHLDVVAVQKGYRRSVPNPWSSEK
jgi:FdhE protein